MRQQDGCPLAAKDVASLPRAASPCAPQGGTNAISLRAQFALELSCRSWWSGIRVSEGDYCVNTKLAQNAGSED